MEYFICEFLIDFITKMMLLTNPVQFYKIITLVGLVTKLHCQCFPDSSETWLKHIVVFFLMYSYTGIWQVSGPKD